MRLLVLPVVLMACGAGLAAMSAQMVPAERPSAAPQVNFDALRQQAVTALMTLRQAPERGIVRATTF